MKSLRDGWLNQTQMLMWNIKEKREKEEKKVEIFNFLMGPCVCFGSKLGSGFWNSV